MKKTYLIRVMKLLTLFMLAGFLGVNAASYSQTVSLRARNLAFREAMEAVRKQTGYHIGADITLIERARPVNVNLRDAALKDALDQIMAGQNLAYVIDGKSIVIKEKEPSLLETIRAAMGSDKPAHEHPATQTQISGRVVNEQGQPLSGATVSVKNGRKAVVTNKEGVFTLKDLATSMDVLSISYVGYLTKEVNASANLDPIVLEKSNSPLDEVMVIGYGTTTQRLSTGSTGSVSGDEVNKQPVSNPVVAMEGRIPGLFITQNAGYSGATPSVVIRGQNSLTFNSASPLYIIDGVPMDSKPVEQSVGGFSAGIAFSPLNTINPEEILRIDVLKDADATAIYGSRGANGVILITTRKGKAGDTQLTVDLSQGFGKASNQVELLSTQEYLALRRQAFANDQVTPTAANAPDLEVWDQQAQTNFPDLLIGNTSHQTTAGVSISGGDAYNQFIFGSNFRRESSVYYSKNADRAVQFRLSTQHKSRNNRFAADISAFYNLDNNTIPNYTMNFTNYGLPPNYPLYNADGSLYFGTGYTNALAAFNATNNLKTSNLNTNASLRYTLLPGLDLKATGGYNLINVEGLNITPSSAQNPANNYAQSAILNNNYIRTYIVEPQLNYQLTSGRSKLTALLGGTWQETETVQPYWLYTTFTNIQLVKSLGALNVLAKSSGYTDYRYASVFGRAEYSWDDKYLLSGNIRRDGSSRFGANNRFGTFGSIAGAWIFSQETILKESLPWLSYGKLRVSYGTIGNDKISDYSYQSNYGASSAYGPLTTLIPQRIANPYLRWEQTKKLDIAAELGFLNDRILFTATYYRNRSSNLLGNTPLAAQTGFGSYTANLPATVQNRGGEFELNTVNVRMKDFRWTSSLNLTIPENKLLKFPDLRNSTYANTYVLGESLNLRTVFRSEGIVDGIATAEDVDGNGVISSGIYANGQGDYIVYGDNDPALYGGFNNTFTYKGFQLDVFFQGIKRTATRGDLNFGTYPGTAYNIPKSMLNIGLRPSYTSGTAASSAYYFYTASDAAVEDASFVRLKNVALSYTVPAVFSKRLNMSSLQLYVRGQNLLTFTGYKGLDPETLTTQVPPLKMFIAGIRANF